MSLKIDSQKKLRKLKSKWKVESWEAFDERENELYRRLYQNREPTIQGTIKLSAGKLKNYTLEIPRTTRPLTSRLKTTIFDVLGPDIVNKTILDLFAGTGSFGFESISRGAKECTFVDAAKAAEKVLLLNTKKTGLLTETTIIRKKADEYLAEAIKDESTEFDIIFMDPPYKMYNTKDYSRMRELFSLAVQLMPGIRNPNTNKFKGAFLVKHPRRYDINKIVTDNVALVDTYDFGLNAVSIFIVKA